VAHDEVISETAEKILVLLAKQPLSRPELNSALGIGSSRAGHFLRATEQLRQLGLIELTIPSKPQSKNQKLRITAKGLAWLTDRNKSDV
jgi:ATP-dependent DNA helicase RecG